MDRWIKKSDTIAIFCDFDHQRQQHCCSIAFAPQMIVCIMRFECVMGHDSNCQWDTCITFTWVIPYSHRGLHLVETYNSFALISDNPVTFSSFNYSAKAFCVRLFRRIAVAAAWFVHAHLLLSHRWQINIKRIKFNWRDVISLYAAQLNDDNIKLSKTTLITCTISFDAKWNWKMRFPLCGAKINLPHQLCVHVRAGREWSGQMHSQKRKRIWCTHCTQVMIVYHRSEQETEIINVRFHFYSYFLSLFTSFCSLLTGWNCEWICHFQWCFGLLPS